MSLTLYFRYIPGIFKTHSALLILGQALRILAYLGTFNFSYTQVYSKPAHSIWENSRLFTVPTYLSTLCFTYIQAYSHISRHICPHWDWSKVMQRNTCSSSQVLFSNQCSNLFGTFFHFSKS